MQLPTWINEAVIDYLSKDKEDSRHAIRHLNLSKLTSRKMLFFFFLFLSIARKTLVKILL